ncbi:MAG: hypothetical protein Q4F31_10830 [Eubacteriales bacterium]|nr:hypothetical protein [Eubacteriales bacterium]
MPELSDLFPPGVVVTHSYDDFMGWFQLLVSRGFTVDAYLPTAVRFKGRDRSVLVYQV